MLGFAGTSSPRSRRHSTTLTALRQARRDSKSTVSEAIIVRVGQSRA